MWFQKSKHQIKHTFIICLDKLLKKPSKEKQNKKKKYKIIFSINYN